MPHFGTCKFCGQMKAIDYSGEEWAVLIEETHLDPQEIADTKAMKDCSCPEGSNWRYNARILEETKNHIEALFREQYPDIADILQETKCLVWGGQIKRISVSTHESGTAVMFRTEGKLTVAFTQKKEKKMTAS